MASRAGAGVEMRRSERSFDSGLARDLFRAAPVVHLASTDADGTPVLRALNVVVVENGEDWILAYHGAPAGEKVGCTGRPAVLCCEEIVASIPSWFTTRERACPATTWYRSAQAHGILEEVEDPVVRAAVLSTLMARFQPEGRHRPISAEEPMYAAAIRGLSIVQLVPTRVSAKVSVGQDKPVAFRHAAMRGLWERGAPGDLPALRLALSLAPEPWPAEWQRGEVRLHPHLGAGEIPEAVALIRAAEWNAALSDDQIGAAFLGSAAWVGAFVEGALVGTARAVSDGAKFAYVADVLVREEWRGKRVGDALMRLLLEHPAVRRCRRVVLRTRLAHGFYERLGFATFAMEGVRPWMALERAGERTSAPASNRQ